MSSLLLIQSLKSAQETLLGKKPPLDSPADKMALKFQKRQH